MIFNSHYESALNIAENGVFDPKTHNLNWLLIMGLQEAADFYKGISRDLLEETEHEVSGLLVL